MSTLKKKHKIDQKIEKTVPKYMYLDGFAKILKIFVQYNSF